MSVKICKAGENIVGLALIVRNGIKFYPLPTGDSIFYSNRKLRKGFFVMKEIPERIFYKIIEVTVGIEKVQDLRYEGLCKISDVLGIELELLGK